MAFHGAATETNRLISPKQFETFSLPYLQRINQACIDMGIGAYFFHICGEQNKNLKFWQQVPMTKQTVISVGREVDLNTAMEMFPSRSWPGTWTPPSSRKAGPKRCWSQSRECIEKAKFHKGGFVLMAGCDVPPHAPPVNVFQLVKAAREYGRY